MNKFFDLIVFILSAYGLTQILVYGTIFVKIRPRWEIFHCTMCMGFWVGGILAILDPYVNIYNLVSPMDGFDFDTIMLACLSSGTSYILDIYSFDKIRSG